MKILLMEDDPVLGDIIHDYLSQFYTTDRAFDSQEAQAIIDEERYDLFIFDINVPGKSGVELIEELRSFNDTTPAIIITAYEDVVHMKNSFDVGAHDYIKKPFDLEELQARIEHIAKVYHLADELTFDRIRFNPKLHKIFDDDKEIDIRQKESAVLEYFIRNQSRIISCDELIECLWSNDNTPTHATIRTYIKNLRKLFDKEYIENIKGEGYRFNIV